MLATHMSQQHGCCVELHLEITGWLGLALYPESETSFSKRPLLRDFE